MGKEAIGQNNVSYYYLLWPVSRRATLSPKRPFARHAHKRPMSYQMGTAVLAAYSWPHNLTDEQILERLLALDLERAARQNEAGSRWE